MCHECARDAADNCEYNFHVNKAEGRRVMAENFRRPGIDFRRREGIDVRDRFPTAFMFQMKKRTNTFKFRSPKEVRCAKRFEQYAKGSRKITEFFNKKST